MAINGVLVEEISRYDIASTKRGWLQQLEAWKARYVCSIPSNTRIIGDMPRAQAARPVISVKVANLPAHNI